MRELAEGKVDPLTREELIKVVEMLDRKVYIADCQDATNARVELTLKEGYEVLKLLRMLYICES